MFYVSVKYVSVYLSIYLSIYVLFYNMKPHIWGIYNKTDVLEI